MSDEEAEQKYTDSEAKTAFNKAYIQGAQTQMSEEELKLFEKKLSILSRHKPQ